jgi:hypothetical protein
MVARGITCESALSGRSGAVKLRFHRVPGVRLAGGGAHHGALRHHGALEYQRTGLRDGYHGGGIARTGYGRADSGLGQHLWHLKNPQ